ncbi:hypothetical protein A9310_22040 [Gordonia sp. UCD-TK1]|nr:hypothetical protein A9310_22040 [Gordonia sp. UCD-TK1]
MATIMDSANKAVKGTAYGLGDAATIAASAVAAGIKPGQQLTKYLTMTADAAAIAGSDLADMGSILNQVATGGTAMTDDLNQFADRGIPIFQWLGKEMGVAAGEVKSLASEGKVSSEILFGAIQKNIGGAAQETGKTFRGSVDNMMAAMGRFGAKLLEPVFSRAPAVFGFLTTGIDSVTKKVGPFVSGIGSQLGNLFKGIDLSGLKDAFANAFSGFDLGSFKSTFSGLFDSLGNLREQLGQFTQQTAPAVVGAMQTIAPIVGGVARTVGTVLAGAFRTLVGVISTAVNVVAGAVRVFNEHRGVILTVGGAIAAVFLPALITAGITMAANAATMAIMGAGMVAYSVAMRVVAVATRAWAAVQWVLNAALSANPIGIVIAAIAAFVAGVVLAYNKSETFRSIVTGAWNGIKAAVGAVWSWLSTTVWPGMQAAFRVIGQVAMWLWRSVILPAWNGIKIAIGVAWTIIKGYFTAYISVVKFLGGVVMWLWNTVIVPAFNGIKAAIGFAWQLIQPIFQAFMSVLRVVGTVATWLWKSVIVPVFNGIKAASQFMWTGVSVVFGWFKAGFSILAGHLRAVVDNVITPVWNAVKAGASFLWSGVKTIFDWIKGGWDLMASAIRTVWENVIRPAFDAVKSAVGKVGDMFSAVAEGIRNTWDKIKGYAAAPIRFVVNTVWNNGLRSVWEKIAGFLPIPKAPAPTPVAFAEGGPVPMGKGAKRGKDSVNALLMPDEHVWDVADVKRAGGHGAMYRMRQMVEGGRPFTWTPGGVAKASEGGPLPRFEKGGAVEAGMRLAPLGGEGGLKPIAVLMRRIIFRLWKQIKDIGGYRQDAYPEHPSGRALDVMVPDLKTGDEVNAWTHANAKKFPIEHTIWKQRWRPQGNINGTPMEDRGSPTQNHMDHVHSWYKEQAVNPDVVPEGLVGFDGMTPEDKRSWLHQKVKEIIDSMAGGIRKVISGTFDGKAEGIFGIPKAFMDKTFGSMLNKAVEVVRTLKDVGKWYDLGKKSVKNVIKSVPIVGGLFRDQGGFLPTGKSVVTNETGKPEAVLNWQQLELIKAIMDKFKVDRATALRKAGIDGQTGKQVREPDSDAAAVINELKQDRKQNGENDSLKAKQDYEQAKLERKQEYDKAVARLREEYQAKRISKAEYEQRKAELKRAREQTELQKKQDYEQQKLQTKQQRDGQNADSAGFAESSSQEPQLAPEEEYRKGLADSISENFGNAAKSAVEGQIQDALGVFSLPDSPPLLAAYNQFVEDKKSYDEMRKKQESFDRGEAGTGSGVGGTGGDYSSLDPSGQLQYDEEQSKVQDVAEGPGGMPNIQYNPGGGAEQWRPLAQWAIDYVNQSMKGPAQLQAMVEQIGDESGGNPKAQNNYDINAQNGVPSGGLLQVIEPTFQAHRDKSLPNDKFHPGANLVAALRYYVPKYGKDLTARWGSGKGGYKKGGYTGNLGVNQVAGFVHGREFVMPEGPTSRNYALLSAMHQGADFTPVSSVGGGADNSTHFHNPVFRDEREFYERQSRMQRARQRAMSGGRG